MKRRILIVCILILSLVLGQISFASAATISSAKPKAPTMNSAVLADDGSVDVVWSKVSGADKYEIYRATSKSGKYTKIATVSSKNRIYNDTDVENYKNYYYKLKTVDDGKKSAYSKVVSAYVEGPRISNDKINYIIKWETGESHNMPAGDAISTTASLVNGTLKYKGMPTDNYKIFYDKENVTIKKGKNGKLQIMPKTPGRYQCTLIIGDEKGTITYDAEIGKYSDLTFSWSQNNWEQDSMSVKIPEYSESTLTMKYNGKAIKYFKVTSSNKNVCTVAKNGSKVTVTNKGPGKCNITVTYKGKKTIFPWIVKRGLATADFTFANSVPVAKSVSKKDAKAIIKSFTTTKYTKKQIEQMVTNGLTLDQCAEKISTAADAVNLLLAMDYGKEPKDLMKDLDYINENEGIRWLYDYSAELNFKLRYGHCAGTSNLMNRLLMDNFEEMGYVIYLNTISGGHIFNYFKVDNLYVICDFVDILQDFDYENKKYPVDITNYFEYICRTPEEFKEKYWMTNPVVTVPDSVEGIMAYFAFYEKKGDPHPTGWPLDDSRVFIMPEQYKDSYNVLFVRDGYTTEFRYLEEDKLPECRKPTHEYLKN